MLRNDQISRRDLAEEACHIEIDLLGEPIGKQDQYIAAFGGITCLHFQQNGEVDVLPLRLEAETLHNLEDNLMLFFTDFTRSASAILQDQDSRSRSKDREMLDNLHFIKQVIGLRKQIRFGSRRSAGVCRADAPALGAKKKPLAGNEQRPHQ